MQWRTWEWLHEATPSHSVPQHWMEMEWLVSFMLKWLDKSSAVLHIPFFSHTTTKLDGQKPISVIQAIMFL
jgi:hypothetical protein